MNARTLVASLAALSLLLALAVAPAGAATKPGWVETERSLRLELNAKASDGYEMRVRTDGHREVTLSLSKGSIEIDYTTTGRVSRKGIEGRIPRARVDRRAAPGSTLGAPPAFRPAT